MVLSGFRTVAHNAAVGGARNSVHLLRSTLPGRARGSSLLSAAADVRTASMTPDEVYGWAIAHRRRNRHLAPAGRGGIGRYSSFIHLDTWHNRQWQG